VVTGVLDGWLATLFDPQHLDDTVAALAAAQEPDPVRHTRTEDARRRVLEADGKLAKYRSALEAGADPVLVAGWIREVQADRERAERVLREVSPPQSLTREEVAAFVASLGNVAARLADASPEVKAAVYQEVGVTVTMHPDGRIVVEARPKGGLSGGVGGGT
jgi:site-specific DNA recombinase